MKRIFLILCLVTAMLITLTAFPGITAEADTYEDTPEDFVIVLDCSMSLGINDPQNLCLEACKNFVDKLPTQNARVSVIAFGYRDSEYYTYSSQFNVEWDDDSRAIHEIVPLGDLSNSAATEEYKAVVEETIMSNRTNRDTWTPIGHALAAGVDRLLQSGSEDEKACVILVSDGVNEPLTTYQDEDLIEAASLTAGEHGWPIYCIELNYNNNDFGQIAEAERIMDIVCSNSGDRAVGRLNCETPRDVHVAFQKIFHDFYNLGGDIDEIVVEMNLPGEYLFTIPELTSELSLDIFGASLEYVELINLSDGSTISINSDVESENLTVAVEEGSYYSIKLFCPRAGEWKAVLHGDDGASVLVSTSPLREMGLDMITTVNNADENLTKDDSITVNAFFSYRDTELHNIDFYDANHATLRVYCSDGTTKEFEMNASKDEYSYDLSLSGIPSGVFTLQVVLKHEIFRNGEQVSNSAEFSLMNMELEQIAYEPIQMHGFVNNTFDTLDLSGLYNNPDNDPLEYELTCINDRTAAFNYSVDADYLTIDTGFCPGTYEMEFRVKDREMASALVYEMTLNVENRDCIVTELGSVDVWTDCYPFQDSAMLEQQIDLSECFMDPDGMELSYVIAQQGTAINFTLDGSQLILTAADKGDSVLTITASDGLSEVSAELNVDADNGKTVYWRQNWIFYAIALGLLCVTVLSVVIILKNKRVKGEWIISVDENGMFSEVQNFDIGAYTRAGRRSSFSLRDFMGEFVHFLDDNFSTLKMNINDYFVNTGAEKVKLYGVYGKSGLKIKNRADTEHVTVSCNAQTVTKTTKMRNGRLVVVIRKADDSGDTLTISMYLQ